MAAPGIAARLHEDGHDIELEADGPVDGSILDRGGQGDGFISQLNPKLGGAIFKRKYGTAFEFCQGWVGKGVFRLGGNVPGQAIGIESLDNHRLPVPLGAELDIPGVGSDLHQVGPAGGITGAENSCY